MIHIERFICNTLEENCYIVSDETKQTVIIDCGAFFNEERKALIQYINKNKLNPIHILCTHAHIDHNFGINTIKEQYNLLPEIEENDVSLYMKLKEQAISFLGMNIDYEFPQIRKENIFTNGDEIVFGNHSFTVISTPGHTKGSVFFYCKDEKIAFSGDTLFSMSIGRTDLEGGDNRDMKESLKRIIELIPEDTIILPGHGSSTNMARERKYNPYINAI